MLLIFSAVLVKVGLLQTFEGDQLRSAAAQQWTRDRPLRAQRGSIFDRNGEELALSVPASTVAVNPKQVTDPVGTAQIFASTLGLDDERRDELAAGDGRSRTRASSTSPARSTPTTPTRSPPSTSSA